MSEPEAPAEARGGPIWSRGGPGPDAPPPPPPAPGPYGTSAPGAPLPGDPGNPPTHFVGATDPTGLEDELYSPHYARDSGSPVPYMAGAAVMMLAAWWGLRWSSVTAGATDPVRSSEWWTNVNAVLLPSEEVRLASYSETRMWVALALLVLAATAIVLWIGRIGTNLRGGQQPFGSFLPIVVFPAWWLLPLSIAASSEGPPSRGDLLVRYLLALGVLVVQFLLMRWPLLNRIWRAGGLRYDLASVLLWLPMMIPWLMLFASWSFTLLIAGERGRLSKSAWQPTEAMLDWARWTTRVTGIAILVLLAVVSVIQHLGVAEDRAALSASRERSRSKRLPLLPPGG